MLPRAPRRINPYIQAALMGAADCIKNYSKRSVDVFMCSSSSNWTVLEDLLESVIVEKEQAKPVSFIHSIGNAASFYVSGQLSLQGESLFLAEGSDYLAHMLLLAAVKMTAGSEAVMLGNLQLDKDRTESNWLLLGKNPDAAGTAKLSFESINKGKPVSGRPGTRPLTEFNQLVRPGVGPQIIGSPEFQRQSGLFIAVTR